MLSVDFYRLPDGTAPVEEFLEELNVKMRNKAINNLEILEEFILTNGFIKKTNKTPRSEIALAEKYKADFERQAWCPGASSIHSSLIWVAFMALFKTLLLIIDFTPMNQTFNRRLPQ